MRSVCEELLCQPRCNISTIGFIMFTRHRKVKHPKELCTKCALASLCSKMTPEQLGNDHHIQIFIRDGIKKLPTFLIGKSNQT